MSGVLEMFEMAVKLREIHATISRLYGPEKFAAHVADIEPVMRKRAESKNGNIYAAAIAMTKEAEDPKLQLLILAVAGEIKLREKAS